MKNPINRRTFLRFGALTSLVSGLSFKTAMAGNPTPQQQGVKQYVTLGRTGLRISDISFG